jgi:hypothetical protein
MAKGQKEAVIEYVKQALPGFVPFKDIALVHLSHSALEAIKAHICTDISNGVVEYSKDPTNLAEVRTYGRSMVMNHLKKAKELNGKQVYNPNPSVVQSKDKPLKGINVDLLPPDLKAFVETLT